MRLGRTTGHNSLNQGGRNPLSNDQLRAIAPSVFAEKPWHAMSAKYAFIPTIQVVERLRSEGFLPFAAMQSRSRIEGKGEFTKHMIRFRDMRGADLATRSRGGDLVVPEVLIVNGHDGTSAYHCMSGIFRFICENGLIVCDGPSSQMSVRHSGNTDGVIDVTYSLVEQFPAILESVERFSAVRLAAPEQEAFATAALALKYDDETPAPITAAELVAPARTEDAEPTLWNTLNTVQEHLIDGGLKYRKAGANGRTRRMKTRAVSGISENTRLNKALWTLANEMAKLAA